MSNAHEGYFQISAIEFSMNRIIKSEDTPDSERAVAAMRYTPLTGELSPSAIAKRMAELQQRMERNERSFALCSMLYALRFLDAAEVRENAFHAGYADGQEVAEKEMQKMVKEEESDVLKAKTL